MRVVKLSSQIRRTVAQLILLSHAQCRSGKIYIPKTNKNGKSYFIDFTKQSKISVHQFIFSHYKKQTENNPSSMAIFDKKLRTIANTIKDDYIKKYVLEYFLEKISELTPHTSQIKKNF